MGGGRNKSAKKWRSKVARVAKRVVTQNLETKRVSVNLTGGQIINSPSTISNVAKNILISNVNVGTTVTDRIGNEIMLKSMRYKFVFSNQGTGGVANDGTTEVRISVFKLNPGIAGTGTSVNNIQAEQIFIGTVNASDRPSQFFIRGPNERDSIIQKTLFDKVYHFTNNHTGQFIDKFINVNIPLHNAKFQFKDVNTTSIFGVDYDIVLFIQMFNAGTAATDLAGSYAFNARLFFKDA